MPSTSPTDFDAQLARDAVKRIVDWGAERLYPTHYGELTDIEGAAAQLVRHLDHAERIMTDAVAADLPDEALTGYCQARLRDYLQGLLDHHGDLGQRPETWALLETDVDLNGQGLAWAATKARKKAQAH